MIDPRTRPIPIQPIVNQILIGKRKPIYVDSRKASWPSSDLAEFLPEVQKTNDRKWQNSAQKNPLRVPDRQ
jgi:hypothetical protein